MPRLMLSRSNMLDALSATGGLSILERVATWSGLLTINYHRIGRHHNSPFDWDLWSSTEEELDDHIRALKKCCEFISINDLPNAIVDSSRLKNRSRSRFVMLTFDDGYRDNFECAYPVLKSHGVPAVFFISTGFVDRRCVAWWDEIAWMVRSARRSSLANIRPSLPAALPLRSNVDSTIRSLLAVCYQLDGYERDRFLNDLAEATGAGRVPQAQAEDLWVTWDMIREIRAGGMSIGSHTVNHPVLSRLSADDQLFELTESRLRLEQELSEPVTALSYPVGRRDSFDCVTRNAMTLAGYDWGFSFYGGYTNGGRLDRLDIPRTAVESNFSLKMVRSLAALPQVFARH